MLVIALAVILAAVIMYSESVSYTVSNVDNIDKSIEDVSNDVTKVISSAVTGTSCTLNHTLTKLFGQIKALIRHIPSKVKESLGDLSGFKMIDSIQSDFDSVSQAFEETIKSMEMTREDAEQIPSELGSQLVSDITAMIETTQKASKVFEYTHYSNCLLG
ncbi:unnamed protein product [Gongylonema pulchrum]|uniref:DUF148 domain-containing protein n=1 Tax=Gongylonema pulchrum TaxID=637853 RepID=A0A3P6QFR7_9BILA|nr:unnamed protein product [Gongylonema pulchrum]